MVYILFIDLSVGKKNNFFNNTTNLIVSRDT